MPLGQDRGPLAHTATSPNPLLGKEGGQDPELVPPYQGGTSGGSAVLRELRSVATMQLLLVPGCCLSCWLCKVPRGEHPISRRYNLSKYRHRRRSLRERSTDAENRLWREIRGGQLGVKFRRQFGVDEYILDFYAPALKLAVEVDGDSHYLPGAVYYDTRRTERLDGLGIRVLRFTNQQVMSEPDAVIEALSREIRCRRRS